MSKKLQYALIFNIAWISLIFFSKKALNSGAEPIPFVIENSIITLVLLTFYVYFSKRSSLRKIKIRDFRVFTGIGAFVAIAWLSETYGLRLSTAINYSFIIETAFVFAVVLAFFFVGEVIHFKKILIMTAIMAGAYLVSTGGALIIPKPGDLLIVLAAFCYSLSNIMQKPVLKRVDPVIVGWMRFLFALLLLLVFITIFNTKNLVLVTPVYVLLAGIASAFTTVYISKTISVSSVSYQTMMSMLTPVVNIYLGMTFLKEAINIYQILGGFLIIGSIILAQDKRFGM